MNKETAIKYHEPRDYQYRPCPAGYDLGLKTKLVIDDLVNEGEDLSLNE
ncbi:MAG: hypothetical protein BMS9Abin31_1204 [Gammaproteobacteria bacterium]|nr:MAG: hypothetical protein BMS9Abin31_1204 [Gammaproteobacteria bacterium]